ncbi:hypothetical protein GBA52_027046 [Prunus armeniaca]|nr:hypothetical protein GBA52_027046 [Prunus armeniaca]
MLCFCLRNYGCSKVKALSAPTEEALELERELQSLNKPPVKTIQLDGDIIDCADINHQPALDHPLLKNHKIQLRPTAIPATQTKKSALYSISKNWWLVVSDKNVGIGYWPKELVPSLEIGAGDVGWGGIAMAQENENAPPVGSGQYPDGTYQHVGYFRDTHFMKDGLHPKVPTDADPVFEYAEVPSYGLQNDKDSKIALEGLVVIVQLFNYSIGMYKEDFEIKEKFRRLGEGVVSQSTHFVFMEDDEELRLLLGFAAPIARAQLVLQ